MEKINGIDLSKIIENADKAFSKAAETRITEYLRGLKIQQHNLQMKAIRLRTESDQASAQADEIQKRIALIQSGDWSAIEPFELKGE